MTADGPVPVALVDVDEAVLDELVRVATTAASANEVTPPLTGGSSWNEARIAWLRDFHRDRRGGLDGPRGESTWAVLGSEGVVGSVRLRRTETPGVLETGIWLARGARGRGLGTAAAAAVVQRATALGATAVQAETASTNVHALAVLRRAGFSLSRTDGSSSVRALLKIRPATGSTRLRGVGVAGSRSLDERLVVGDDGSVSSIPLAVLPDPEDDNGLQAWTHATADGVPLRLLVDTGTPRSAVPYVEPFVTRPRRLAPGGRGAFVAPAGAEMLVEAEVLRTGDLVTRQLLVQLQPEGWRHPGLLGLDVLGSHRCDFSFDVPRIDLDRPARPDATWYPLTTAPHQTPRVQVAWGQTSLTAVWDTGAGVTLVDQSWAGQHPDIVAVHPETGHGFDVTGAEASHHWGTMAACRVGDTGFAEQTCAVVDLSALNATLASPVEVVIGLPLIAQASWCMDYPGRRWTVWP